jgi:hypothetical protein
MGEVSPPVDSTPDRISAPISSPYNLGGLGGATCSLARPVTAR